MPSDAPASAPRKAVILAAKVLAGNRRVPALQKALLDAGWSVDLLTMNPVPEGLDAIGLGSPGQQERWMDRARRLGGPGKLIASKMKSHGRARYAADRRARYFAELVAYKAKLDAADLVLAHDAFAAGWAAENLPDHVPLVADLVEDIEARTYSALDMPDPDLLVRRPDAILTISDSMKDRLVSLGANPQQVSVILNALPRARVATVNEQSTLDLVSAGTLYPGDGVDHLIGAASAGGYSLVIVGHCPDEPYAKALAQLIEQSQSPDIQWKGAVPPEELAQLVRSARASVLAYTPGPPNFQHAMPNRVFSSLAAGTPLLVQSGLDAARWVEARGIGAAIDFRSAASAAEGLKAALDEEVRQRYANAALKTAQEIAWEVQSEAFLTTISALQGARSMPGRDGDSS